MVISVLKRMLRRPPEFDRRLDEWSRSASYDAATLHAGMLAKVDFLKRRGYLRYPAIVHLETLASCNAACDFCPYPMLERQGVRMPDALIDKVLRDLADIPRELPFQLLPFKVSEPFVEARLFDILHEVNARLPNARICLISNGAAITDRKIEDLRAVRSIAYLTLSLNFEQEQEYEAVMHLPYKRTIARLDAVHAAKAAGRLAFDVRLSRVSKDRGSDQRYLDWAKARYPAFVPIILSRNDWIGDIPGPGVFPGVPDVPCHRWFDLSITATGKVAMCCMDGEAQYPKGDVTTQHALEIYNQPRLLELRERLLSRRAVAAPCNRCTYLSA